MKIKLQFTYVSESDYAEHTVENEFYVDAFLGDSIDEFVDTLDGELQDSEVIDCPDNIAAPEEFDNFNEYGEYAEKCEEYGEAYILRYADIGDFDFEDEYNGCWDSEEEFVYELCSETLDLKLPPYIHVDWERTTRDIMMDYSSYTGRDGVHIFRD